MIFKGANFLGLGKRRKKGMDPLILKFYMILFMFFSYHGYYISRTLLRSVSIDDEEIYT